MEQRLLHHICFTNSHSFLMPAKLMASVLCKTVVRLSKSYVYGNPVRRVIVCIDVEAELLLVMHQIAYNVPMVKGVASM
jgi:hypothetical protein